MENGTKGTDECVHTHVCIVGAGVMGSATACTISHRLKTDGTDHKPTQPTVVVLEQYSLLHRLGSSHGESRIIRKAYPKKHYTDMMNHCWTLWEKWQDVAKVKVITHTKGLDFGSKNQQGIHNLIASCVENGVAHELVDSDTIRKRYPGIIIPDDYIGAIVEDAGVVHATKSCMMFQQLARDAGTQFYENEGCADIYRNDDGSISIKTSLGRRIVAKKVIVTAGAWTKVLLQRVCDLELPLNPIHTTSAYWAIDPQFSGLYSGNDKSFPVVIDYTRHDYSGVYITPELEYKGLIKISHHSGPPVEDPNSRRMLPGQNEIEKASVWIRKHLKGIQTDRGAALAEPCMYTMTPDTDFLLDKLPEPFDNIVIGGGFSGHGFKVSLKKKKYIVSNKPL